MPKINIYVTKELKNRVEERKDLNWSRVFQDCVEALLDAYPEPAKPITKERDVLYVASNRRH